jgi:hypothetical protein
MRMLTTVRGVIARRVLLNYRVDPDVLQRQLPPPFRPLLHRGHGVAGVCLIRLEQMRPRGLPRWCGLASENAAHRIAVAWEQDGEQHTGVFIPRRDTGSAWNAAIGGRLFPGEHHRSRFVVCDGGSRGALAVRVVGAGGTDIAAFAGHPVAALPATSVFASLDEASTFFRRGAKGCSVTRDPRRFDTIELDCATWSIEPLAIDEARSLLFDDPMRFPAGSIALDCALAMRGIEHRWRGLPDVRG